MVAGYQGRLGSQLLGALWANGLSGAKPTFEGIHLSFSMPLLNFDIEKLNFDPAFLNFDSAILNFDSKKLNMFIR